MREFAYTYKQLFSSREYLWAFLSGFVLFIGSLFVNFYAGLYATEIASNSVTDIILSNIRVYNVDAAFIYGTGLLFFFILFLCLYRPQWFPFMFKSIALFIVIRSVFISLTHLGPFPTHVIINPLSIINFFSFGADLFFSGHTGIPFLVALIFWNKPLLRYTFIAISIFFAVVVLLGHLHYSIDVLSAYFITYSIYHIALVFFKKDHEIFEHGTLKT
jgi:hypothetical protein